MINTLHLEQLEKPLVFEPLPMERVWGGKKLGVYEGKSLPPGVSIGELWELVDRKNAQSVVHSGPLQGQTLHFLWKNKRKEIFGARFLDHSSSRFPILCKLLDARERLSVQVHPNEEVALALRGEPKSEVWYFLDAIPGAKIYAGLKKGVSAEKFKILLESGHVEKILHEIPVRIGASIYIPSGRLHAIGEGNVIVEIQQNSDTTFRVFDWNRRGLNGQPRALHIEESLISLDFEDVEPQLQPAGQKDVANCKFFHVEFMEILQPMVASYQTEEFAIFTVVSGCVTCAGEEFSSGQFFLVPACLSSKLQLFPKEGKASILRTTLP